MTKRPALTRSRIIDGAVAVADRGGLVAVSMRNVGQELGVEAMSLYHHIVNKDALLDALADWIFTEIEPPITGAPWRPEMTTRATSARSVLFVHPWALSLIESRRTPGPASLQHHDAVLGCLRRGGFSVTLAAHAFSVLDAYVYGFVLTEVNIPLQRDVPTDELVEQMAVSAQAYPHLTEMMAELVMGKDYAFGNEFGYGLELILDELERRLGLSSA